MWSLLGLFPMLALFVCPLMLASMKRQYFGQSPTRQVCLTDAEVDARIAELEREFG